MHTMRLATVGCFAVAFCIAAQTAAITIARIADASEILPETVVPTEHTDAVDQNDIQWMRKNTIRLLKDCQLNATERERGGTSARPIFTPDGTHAYGAQWTRDFFYMLSNAPELVLESVESELGHSIAESLDRTAASLVMSSIDFTLLGQRNDGCMPDRVQADGTAVYGPGSPSAPFSDHAWDNMPFASLLVTTFMNTVLPMASELCAEHGSLNASHCSGNDNVTKAYFCPREPVLRLALDFVNRSHDGLVYNDENAPNCTYGFTDTVAKGGRLLFTSLLYHQASVQMGAASQSTGCGDAAEYHRRAAAVNASIGVLFDNVTGMFFAADKVNRQVDVWGSLFAVQQGVGTYTQRRRVIEYIVKHARGLFHEGQLRHLPAGEYWERCFGDSGDCPKHGTYQNGAYWSTPLSWAVPALVEHGHQDMAMNIVKSAIAEFRSRGIYEDFGTNHYVGVRDYVASATNVWAAMSSLV